MKKMKPELVIAIIGTLFITGCVSTGPRRDVITSLPNIPLEDTQYMPERLLDSTQKTVFVMPTKITAGGINKEFLKGEMQGQIENALASAGINTIDRSLASQLHDELLLAESTGRLNYDGPKVADFAIFSTISSVSAHAEYHEGGTSLITGKDYGPSCEAEAGVKGQIRILTIPEMRQVISAEMNGTDSSDLSLFTGCQVTKSLKMGLITNAATRALKSAQNEIKNSLAPAGYVVERRGNEKDNVFRVSLGAARGAKGGSLVEIKRKKITDLGNGETISEFEVIAEGRFTESIEPMYSWIILSDEQKLKIIQRGDLVTLKHEDGLLMQAAKSLKSLNL
ncbi:hypothetical protein SAMN04488540_102188 [Ferrimonas sediminum]|uniref:Cyclic nucleotide-binding domain-containing protein n=1 Tax=Ferrimonas sediminum TaxID=718193 RepID=A0A1G8LW21_9GAMM|nr:hypothetical protein [Ferrimonas sediminum]SDI59879.1 hypothetical protein SAMN04488540_102188 [Ferrimonas sediminum]